MKPGIIPADAGSTKFYMTIIHKSWDHPRRCGEHAYWLELPVFGLGSSPQMRGAHVNLDNLTTPMRIIPADAGSTISNVSFFLVGVDHPRRCGEHLLGNYHHTYSLGSSPQMRGAHLASPTNTGQPGIIPADAGSTCPQPPIRAITWDHPRRCGEHSRSSLMDSCVWGSSPQMRGARFSPPGAFCIKGIIPADAGSTKAQDRQ